MVFIKIFYQHSNSLNLVWLLFLTLFLSVKYKMQSFFLIKAMQWSILQPAGLSVWCKAVILPIIFVIGIQVKEIPEVSFQTSQFPSREELASVLGNGTMAFIDGSQTTCPGWAPSWSSTRKQWVLHNSSLAVETKIVRQGRDVHPPIFL